MKYNTGLKSALLASSGLILLMASTMNAGAQNVSVSGENALVENPCRHPGVVFPIVTVPEPCATVTYTPLAPYNDPTFTLNDYYKTGIIIGKDGHGEIEITDGGVAKTAHLVIGNEEGASGSVIISGAGSEYANYSSTTVGNAGSGELIIRDGGIYRHINTDHFYVGYEETSDGNIEVSGVSSTGQRSSLIVRNRIYFGNHSNATMSILDGGLVSAEYTTIIGEGPNSNSSILVSGVNSASGYSSTFEVLHNQLWVGWGGKGELKVADGGFVKVQDGIQVGGEETGVGLLHVGGVNEATGRRSTVNANVLNLGYYGDGVGVVVDGGRVDVNNLVLSRFINSKGTLSIGNESGDGSVDSTVSVSANANIGYLDEGHLNVFSGGFLTIGGNLLAGDQLSGKGIINVLGPKSNISANGDLILGGHGTGDLSLSNGGTVNAGAIVMARDSTGKGTINIGVGGLGGTLNTSTITGGLGEATINFNHIDDLDFTPEMTGGLTVNQMNIGTTTLASNNTYSGLTTISAGALKAGGANVFSANSDHAVDELGMLDMSGYSQTLRSLNNAGFVRFGGDGGTVLDVAQTYSGNGGTIEFNTVLGDDTSVTDKMIAAATDGASFIRVRNAGGSGAQTKEGIRLIEVGDTLSTGTFSLLGDYVFEGDQAVVGGAYAYRLYQGGTSDPDNGHWYLRSSLKPEDPVDPTDPEDPETPERPERPERPLYQPGVPLYESYPQALLGLNGLATLQQRVGDRYWSGNGNRVISQGADTIEYYAPAEEAGPYTDGNGVWGRIEGAHNRVNPKFSTSLADHSQNVFRMQAGVDMLLGENMDGMLIGGVFAHYVHGKTKVRSIYGHGDISTDGYGFGGSLTWYGNEGFYVDGQAQATWYASDLTSTLANTGLVSGNKGFGYALSLETGKRFAITPEWSVTPQAQLTYSNVDFDSFHDVWNAHVSLDKGSDLKGRLGVALDHEASWQNDAGLTDRAHIYGLANLYYGFTSGARVNVASTMFTQEQMRLWGGLGLGGSYNWNDDKYSIYGEGEIKTSLNSFGDSYTLKGNIGFRVKW